jgi:hypothetical protein
VIAEPPLFSGALHETVAWPSPGVALTPVGAPGTVAGVTGEEATEAAPVPIELVAVTVNVYGVPLVRPVTTADVAPVVLAVNPPGEDVTV